MLQKFSFALVGVANTLIDFALFNSFILLLGLPVVAANIMATTVAMVFSFIVNRKYVFKVSHELKPREVVLFFAVTIAGLWGLQTIILMAAMPALASAFPALDPTAHANIAKVIATGASTIWNYVLYKYVVFVGAKNHGV